MFRCQLQAYEPLGDKRGVLRGWRSWAFVSALNDTSTLSVAYDPGAPHAEWLDGAAEVAVEWYDDETPGDRGTEPLNARLVTNTAGRDDRDPDAARPYSLLGMTWFLRKARVWNPSVSDPAMGPVKPERTLVDVAPGQAIRALLLEARIRGWAKNAIDWSFSTNSADSAGVAWPAERYTYTFPVEDSLEGVLERLTADGLLDWSWSGRTLNVYVPRTYLMRDLHLGDAPVMLRLGPGVRPTPGGYDFNDLADVMLIVAEQGVLDVAESGDDDAERPFGRLEGAVTAAGSADQLTAQAAALEALRIGAHPRDSLTLNLDLAATDVVPFRDFRVGDKVLAPAGVHPPGHPRAGDTRYEVARVLEIGISYDRDSAPDGLAYVVLNNRQENLVDKVSTRLARIVSGTKGGRLVSSPAEDLRQPAVPPGLTVAAVPYEDEDGNDAMSFDVGWADVAVDTTGAPLYVPRYALQVKREADNTRWLDVTQVDTNETKPINVEGAFTVGALYRFRIAAISHAVVYSEWSNPTPPAGGAAP